MINLYNADCIESMKKLKGESIDLIVTDPPYMYTNTKFDSVGFDEKTFFLNVIEF